MKKCFIAAALLASLLLVRAGIADDNAGVKSGPQVGEVARPQPFLPLNINGPTATVGSIPVASNPVTVHWPLRR